MFLKYDIKVRIGQKEASFGKGVIELMEGVERTGSLSAAYKAMNMSSSKAWKIIQRAQQLSYLKVKAEVLMEGILLLRLKAKN